MFESLWMALRSGDTDKAYACTGEGWASAGLSHEHTPRSSISRDISSSSTQRRTGQIGSPLANRVGGLNEGLGKDYICFAVETFS